MNFAIRYILAVINRTMEILEVDAYMPNGTQYDNVDYDKDPEPIEGNTNGQAIYRLLWQ